MANMKPGNFKPLKLKDPITVGEAAKIYGGHYTTVIRHINMHYFKKVDRSADRILLERAEVVEVYKTKHAENGAKINGPIQGKSSPTAVNLKPETFYLVTMIAKNKGISTEQVIEDLLADTKKKLFKDAKL